MDRIKISREEFVAAASRSVHFYGIDLEKLSTLLLGEIAYYESAGKLNSFSITDAIKANENDEFGRITKEPAQFRHQPLKGLYKVHYFDARFIPSNFNAHYGISKNGNGNKKLDRVISDAFRGRIGENVDDGFAMALGYDLQQEVWDKRILKRRATGEWVIFQKYKDNNYYLTLGFHKEDDDTIFNRVKMVYETDFPFLDIQST